jgi:hypothetical protein
MEWREVSESRERERDRERGGRPCYNKTEREVVTCFSFVSNTRPMGRGGQVGGV